MRIEWRWLRASVLVLHVCTSHAQKPISVPASQFWDGDDGPWSTFRIGVGADATQQIRVLPASSQSSTWLVLPEACGSTFIPSGSSCNKARGGLYMRNESRTWKEFGQYELATYLEKRVGYDGLGLYGYDAMTLGWPGDGAPTLQNQSIAGIISPNFTLGSLALSAHPINFTNYNNPIPSLLQNLRDSSARIPSLSWSYTAGAYNQAPKVFGSLVLGGYDANRFKTNDLTFPFGSDISLDLQVAIQSISIRKDDKSLLSSPITTYINTLVPDIWLPDTAVDTFTKLFNLTYDSTNNYFYVDKDAHEKNLQKGASIKFRIGPRSTGDSTIINMSYNLLAMAIKPQFAAKRSGAFRFPIRRASSEDQYVLGRAFLQSAYLSVDYERNTFKVSEAVFPASGVQEKIVPILPPVSKDGLSVRAIAGIAVGGAIALLIIATLIWFYYRRKTERDKGEELKEEIVAPVTGTFEMEGEGRKYELPDGGGLKHEMMGDMELKAELPAGEEQQKRADVANIQTEIYELPATEWKRVVEGEGEEKIQETEKN